MIGEKNANEAIAALDDTEFMGTHLQVQVRTLGQPCMYCFKCLSKVTGALPCCCFLNEAVTAEYPYVSRLNCRIPCHSRGVFRLRSDYAVRAVLQWLQCGRVFCSYSLLTPARSCRARDKILQKPSQE